MIHQVILRHQLGVLKFNLISDIVYWRCNRSKVPMSEAQQQGQKDQNVRVCSTEMFIAGPKRENR